MSEDSKFSKERILKNSAFLYLRMLFTMWFNLWATRLVLSNLGLEDMGVYGVVGSIVSFFSVLTAGVTTAVQRYITFELGRPDGHPNRVFCTSVNVVFVIAFALAVVLEIFGLLFLDKIINIPEGKYFAAGWVYQLSVVTAIVNLIGIPYNAVIVAHERMDAYAVISVFQVLLGWGAAFCLSWINRDARLITYAVLLTLAGIIIRIIYQIYCTNNFDETHYHYIFDKALMKQLGKFTGVAMTSNILYTLSAQGIVLVINWTFGVGINAIYQISIQLKNSVQSFGMNIFKAISPQITKTYADGDMQLHEKLVYSGCKIEAFMILIIMIPFILRARYIMHLWLGKVPEYTTAFCICAILLSLTYACLEPIRTAVYATNRVTKFLIIPDSVFLCTVIPCSFIVAKISSNPIAMMASIVGLDIFSCILRVFYARKVCFLRVRPLIKQVIIPVIKVLFLSSLICYLLSLITKENIIGLLILLAINTVATIVIIYVFGVNKVERAAITITLNKLKKNLLS